MTPVKIGQSQAQDEVRYSEDLILRSRPKVGVSKDGPSKGEAMLEARDRLILALDLPSVAAAEKMVDRLGDTISFYKVGYQLAFAGGLPFAEALIRRGE